MSSTLHNPRTSSSLPFPLSPCSNTVPFPLLHGAVPLEGSENLPPPRVRAQRVETQRRSQPPTPLEAFHTALQHVRMMSLRAQLSTAPSHEKHAVIDAHFFKVLRLLTALKTPLTSRSAHSLRQPCALLQFAPGRAHFVNLSVTGLLTSQPIHHTPHLVLAYFD
ncbi:hypothetical protein R3P38DRAFT_3193404 [Favolaschia claudopus]|uniref:Uncharacterized protein n=1 Tax=Favolaschia claudopus TaxID=2862362 RepID=A0AAW0BHE7_9AGAR